MEIQKNLFKLSEKILLNSRTKNACRVLCVVSLLLSVVSVGVFVLGVMYYSKGTDALQKCCSVANPASTALLDQDAIFLVYHQSIRNQALLPPQQYLFLNNTENGCVIYKNVENSVEADLTYSFSYNLQSIQKQTLVSRHFDNYTIVLSPTQFSMAQRVIFGIDQLIINQLLEGGFFKNNTSFDISYRSEHLYFNTLEKPQKIWTLVSTLIGVLIISIISLLYIYATIISAPSFIINIIDLFKIENAIHRVTIYKVFPWIGIYMHPLDQHQNSKSSSYYVNNAMILEFVFVYFVYFGIMIGVGNLLFVKPIMGSLNENFFGVMALAEFCSLLFFRTRTSIKYFPTIFICLQWMLAYYCSTANFGYKNWLLTLTASVSLLTLSFLVVKIQIPAQQTWDKQMAYTPNEQRPRTVYFPHYNLLWNNDVTDIQTVGVPSFGRSEFLAEEMALVDQNFDLLNQMLATNQQQV